LSGSVFQRWAAERLEAGSVFCCSSHGPEKNSTPYLNYSNSLS
jgi:hypothetical protein